MTILIGPPTVFSGLQGTQFFGSPEVQRDFTRGRQRLKELLEKFERTSDHRRLVYVNDNGRLSYVQDMLRRYNLDPYRYHFTSAHYDPRTSNGAKPWELGLGDVIVTFPENRNCLEIYTLQEAEEEEEAA